MNKHDLEISKIKLDCVRNTILQMQAMLAVRQRGYENLENKSEGIIQNFLFEKHLLFLVNCIETNVTDVFRKVKTESESEE